MRNEKKNKKKERLQSLHMWKSRNSITTSLKRRKKAQQLQVNDFLDLRNKVIGKKMIQKFREEKVPAGEKQNLNI